MADIFERLVKNYGPIGEHRERAHGYFTFPKLEGEIGSRMKFRGKEVVVWSLNNYLGLANHPEIRKVDAEAAGGSLSERRGVGGSAAAAGRIAADGTGV